MSLYHIKREIEDLIDYETGEIIDPEAYENLEIELDELLTNIALLAKNTAAEITAIQREETLLHARRKAAEKTLAWCKQTLKTELHGEKLKDTAGRFTVYYRNSDSLKIKDFAAIPQKFKREFTDEEKEKLVDKSGIKLALKHGEEIQGVYLEPHINLCIH